MKQFKLSVFCFIVLLLIISVGFTDPPSKPLHIYGIHSWGFGAGGMLHGKTGWTVEVVNTDTWPYDPTLSDIQNMNRRISRKQRL